MTTYHPFKVNLSNGQKEKLARAYKTSSPITFRSKNSQLTGIDELMLTAQQINKINKAKSLGKGSDIKISKSHIRSVMREGSGIFSAIFPVIRSVAPTIGKTLGLSALGGLASEGVSQLVKKIKRSSWWLPCRSCKLHPLFYRLYYFFLIFIFIVMSGIIKSP